MSWNAPKNWAEAIASVERGWAFNFQKEGLRGAYIAVCSDPRHELVAGHLDDFAHEIIASRDRLHAAYMSEGRPECFTPEDVIYFVMKDRNPIAYVTRGGNVKVNPLTLRAPREYRRALIEVEPALKVYAEFCAARKLADWL